MSVSVNTAQACTCDYKWNESSGWERVGPAACGQGSGDLKPTPPTNQQVPHPQDGQIYTAPCTSTGGGGGNVEGMGEGGDEFESGFDQGAGDESTRQMMEMMHHMLKQMENMQQMMEAILERMS